MVFDALISSMEQDDVIQIERSPRRGCIIKDIDILEGDALVRVGDIITSGGFNYVVVDLEEKRNNYFATLMQLDQKIDSISGRYATVNNCFERLYHGYMQELLVDNYDNFTNRYVGIPYYRSLYKYREFIEYYYPTSALLVCRDDYLFVKANGDINEGYGYDEGYIICFAKIKISRGDINGI